MAATLTARLFELTKLGGTLLIPNFAPSCPDRGYMESCMAWDLIYRDEYDMTRLVGTHPRGPDRQIRRLQRSIRLGCVPEGRETHKPTPSVIDFGSHFRPWE